MSYSLALNPAHSWPLVKDTKGVSLYKNISLALVFMSSPSLVVNEIVDLTLGNLSLGNGLIFLNLLWLTCVSSRNTEFSKLQKTIFTHFLIIIFYFLAVWIALYGLNLTGSGPRGIIRAFFHALCFFVILNDPRFDIQRLTRFIVRLGFVLGGLSLILYFGYMFGWLSLKAVVPPGYSEGQICYEGVGGYLNTYYYTSRFGFSYRSQSYFSEPTNFAQFLILPAFLAGEMWRHKKNAKNFLVFATVVYAFILTFSVAAFFGALTALVLYFLFRKAVSARRRRLRVIAFNLLLLAVSSWVLHSFYIDTNTKFATSVIAKDTDENIKDRQRRFETALSVLRYSPFGDLRFREQFNDNPGMLGGAIIDGGLPVTFIMILFLAKLFTGIVWALKRSRYTFLYIGSIAYFVTFFWDGQLQENFFLMFIVLYTTYLKNDAAGQPLL